MADLDRQTMEKLGTTNYPVWKQRIKGYLASRDLWAPILDAEHADSFKAQGVMANHVRDEHLSMVMDAASAKAAWDALEAVFAGQGRARKMALKQDFCSMRLQSGEDSSQFVSRATGVRNALAAAGSPVTDEDFVTQILNGLSAEYAIVVALLSNQVEDISIIDLTAKLLQHEQQQRTQRAISSEEAGSSASRRDRIAKAFMADQSAHAGDDWGGPQQRGRGRGRGRGRTRGSSDDRDASGSKKHLMACHNCGVLGHFAKECRKPRQDHRNGEPPQDRGGVALGAIML